MAASLRIVRLLQIAMLLAIALYVVVGELVAHRATPNLTLFYALSFLSVSTVGAILVVRRTLVAQSEQQLIKNPADAIALGRWRTGYIVTYALCEALALVGLVLRLVGFGMTQVWPYYLGGFALLAMFVARPQRPESN
jgi:hypothetical protein